MSDYRVATGSNVALVSLTVLSPQPTSEGIKPTRRSFGADSTILDEAKYVELVWSLLPSVTTYQAILTLFGVNSALYANVTVYVRSGVFSYVRMNGVAVQPQPGNDIRWQNSFPRQVTILVRDLSVAS